MSTIASSPSLTDNPRCCDWIDLSRPGTVVLKSGKVEIGQGITTALVQIAAVENGLLCGRRQRKRRVDRKILRGIDQLLRVPVGERTTRGDLGCERPRRGPEATSSVASPAGPPG